MRLLGILLIGGLLAGCGLIRSDSGATRDSLIVVIQPREVGVVLNTPTGELGDPLGPGTYVINPLTQEVSVYFTGQQEYTMMSTVSDGQPDGDAISARTSDGQMIYVSVTLLYSIDPAEVNNLYGNLQFRYDENFIRPTVRGLIRETVAEYTAEQLYGTYRATLEADAQERIAESMGEQGLILTDLLVRDIHFTEVYSRMIESTLFAEVTLTAAAQVTATPSP